MSTDTTPTVQPGAFLTLHYRLAGPDGGDIVNTFTDKPATLSLGSGELSPALEARLIGLAEGTRTTIELAPGEAFGPRNPELVQKVSLALKDGSVHQSEVIASQYTGWTEGKLIFRNEDMGQVAQRLSRWYNAEIIIADNQLLEFTFYATFIDEPLDEVLKLLAFTTPISVVEEKRLPRPDGSFAKRKITLRLNPAKVKKFN